MGGVTSPRNRRNKVQEKLQLEKVTCVACAGLPLARIHCLLRGMGRKRVFTHAANLLVAAHVPASVAAALGLSRLTALRKPGGGVCGIATCDTFRRLVSRSLARMFADTFDEGDSPVPICATDKGWHGRTVRHASRRCRPRLCGDNRVT